MVVPLAGLLPAKMGGARVDVWGVIMLEVETSVVQSKYEVMVVEDNLDFAENLAEIICQMGPKPEVFHSLVSARERLAHCSPDICFIDLRLPDGDGEELVAEMGLSHPETLTIVLTGNASIQSAISVVNAGAFGFLLKDMPVEGILTSFRRACERIDLERQKRDLESKLRHQEQLAMIGQMSATLAHEIKNPLTGISQALEILLEAVGEPENMLGLKDSILTRFRAMNDLVEDLLEFSKPLNVKKTETSIRDLLLGVEEELRQEGRLKTVTLVFDLDDNAQFVSLDEVHFRILLRNLFRNAEQAMKGQSVQELRIKSRRVGSLFTLEIADTGCGIPEDQIEKVFEPFFTTKTRGTGLGLALSHRILDEHEGAIRVSNRPNSGACFTMELND